MVRILLEVFVLAFSLIFCGCPVCQIKDNVLIEQLIELCADVEWLFKSYEERIEYSLRQFLDNIKDDLTEYQKLRERVFRFVEELKLSGKQGIKAEEIENFLKKFFDPNIKEERAYIFAKEQVKETLNKLNSSYEAKEESVGKTNLEKGIDFQIGRKELQKDKTAEECINHIALSIYIAKDTIEKKNGKLKEFISELKKLYESEHGEVGGFVKLQQCKEEENYNDSFYNIGKLYEIVEKFYKEGKVCVNDNSDSIAEVFANAFVEFYKGGEEVDKDKQKEMFENEIDKDKQKEMFENEIKMIRKDVIRTFPNFNFKEQEKYDEFKKILFKMISFAVFCIRVINGKEDFPSLSVDDIRKGLSGMADLGEEQIQQLHEDIKNGSTSVGYYQGLSFFAGFFVTLYFLVNPKFGGNVNNEEIIDESGIIKLFVFYLLHKWDCDSSVNYLPPCSLYDTCAVPNLLIFIFLRRFKLLHMYNNYNVNRCLLPMVFGHLFFSCSLSQPSEDNKFLDYIMNLDLHLYIVKKKDINFYFDWFNFLYYKILDIIEKKNLEYYGDGPYTEIVKVLFSSDTKIVSSIQAIFSGCLYF